MYTTNEIFRKLFLKENCTQIEMGHRIELDKHSVHDWLKNKTQLRFNKLEKIANMLGKKIEISIKEKEINGKQ
jgi:transcriptional regulator with XRE-family HTH domain